MSDTPETDKEWRHPASFDGSERVVHISVAQKRERERDEAREDLKITQEAWVKAKAERVKALRERDEAWKFLREATKQRDDALEELEVCVKERDKAREEAAHWKTEYEIVVDRLRGRKHPRDNGIIADDEIIPKLERERDEAREELANLEALMFGGQVHFTPKDGIAWRVFYAVMELKKERDEARARVELIKPHKNNPVAEYFSSNTPETDEAVKASNGQWSFVRNLLKQRLARERNELMKALEAAK